MRDTGTKAKISSLQSTLNSLVTGEVTRCSENIDAEIIRLTDLVDSGALSMHQERELREALTMLHRVGSKVKIAMEAQSPVLIEGPKVVPMSKAS